MSTFVVLTSKIARVTAHARYERIDSRVRRPLTNQQHDSHLKAPITNSPGLLATRIKTTTQV
jgi:hypothetical protein